jgi:DNA polymerase I-like protein with 3'-5' exonuclease and polymerase domains
MPLVGDGLAKVCLVFDDEEERRHWMLKRILTRAGLNPSQFYTVTTQEWVRPVTEAPEGAVRVLVPMGETALRVVTEEVGIARHRGRVLTTPSIPGVFVIPTYKPSRLLPRPAMKGPDGRPIRDPDLFRNPSRFTGQVIRDLHYAVHVARHGFERSEVFYSLDPPPGEFQTWVEDALFALSADSDAVLSFDIETPYKLKEKLEDDLEESEADGELNTQILRISFAYKANHSVTVPWRPEYLQGIRRLLESEFPKLVWNGLWFDVPVLAENGITVGGTIYDGMDAFHVWESDLPKGLEAVSADFTDVLAWKHQSESNPKWYSAADSDVALRNFLGIRDALKKEGMWDAYLQDSVELMPILIEAGLRGNTIDLAYQEQLRVEFTAELAQVNAVIQTVVPEHLKPRHRYKKTPDVDVVEWDEEQGRAVTTDGRVFRAVNTTGKVKFCSRCGARDVRKSDHAKATYELVPVFTKTGKPSIDKKTGQQKVKKVRVPHPCEGAAIEVRMAPVIEWDEVLPFNAGSSEQLKAYMRFFKHPLGVDKKDQEKETADRKHLEKLAKHYPQHKLYPLAVQHHLLAKAIGTYLWKVGPDGKVHTTYVNSPSTWRLGSRAVNLQNVPKRDANKYAKKARRQIIARPGYKLVQADSTSIEAVMLGWFMGDLEYIALANKSVHTWLALKELGDLPFTDENAEMVKEKHKNLYNQMKVANHMTNYGGSAYVLWQTFPEYFPTKRDAERVQNRIFELLPKLEEFHYAIRYQGQKEVYVRSPFGHRHAFYDVFTHKRNRDGELEYTQSGRPKLKLGKDGKRIVAYKPQHSAGIFMRRNLLAKGRTKWRQYMPANVSVHDGYTLEVPDALVDEAIAFLGELLTRPIVEMGGLRVGCAIEVGENWGDYHPTDNPKGMREVKKITIEEQQLEWLGQTTSPTRPRAVAA